MLRRSNTLESDAFDLRTALESLIRRMLEANRTRSFEGSTDDQVDIEGWAGSLINTFQMFPMEIVQESPEENVRNPDTEKAWDMDGPRPNGLKRRRTRTINIEALKKRCKGLQESSKALTAANEELQQAKYAAATECERLTEENKGLREEVAEATADSEHLTGELAMLWEMFEAEKKRADDAEKERDEVHGMIAEKRRDFEKEKLQHEELVWELGVYRSLWHEPSSILAIKRASREADEFNAYKEEEEDILQDVEAFVRNGLHEISRALSEDDDGDSRSALESQNRRIVNQRAQITLLEMRLAKANAEQRTDVDQVILDLGFQLDDALEELQSAYKDRTAADIARDEALARAAKLETRIRRFRKGPGGSKQASAFSAVTLSGITRISRALGNIMEEEEEGGNVRKVRGDKGAATGVRTLAAELEDLLDDVRSEVTTRVTLDGQGDNVLEKYNLLVLDNARLLEDGARLQRQIRHLENRDNRMDGAKSLISRNNGRAAMARIQELEKLISSQLTFHRDIRGLLTSAETTGNELHDVEADVLRRLEMPQETGAKVEALLEKVSHGAGDDVDIQEVREAREAISQTLHGVGRTGGMKLRGKWLEFNKESGKLAKFVGSARDKLQDGALRLGIKVRTSSAAQTLHPRLTCHRDPSPLTTSWPRRWPPLSTPTFLPSSSRSASPTSLAPS